MYRKGFRMENNYEPFQLKLSIKTYNNFYNFAA